MNFEREERVIFSHSLTLEQSKVTVPLLVTTMFYDLSAEKVVTIPGNPERRERDRQELVRKAKKPVVLLVDAADPDECCRFRKQLAVIGVAAELPFPIHPHMLRHAVSGRPRPRWTRHGRWTGDRGAEANKIALTN